MSEKFMVVLNREGVRGLLKSEDVKSYVEETAKAVQAKCGEEYTVDTYVGKNRVSSRVSTATIHAIKSNLKHNTLLKAVSTHD